MFLNKIFEIVLKKYYLPLRRILLVLANDGVIVYSLNKDKIKNSRGRKARFKKRGVLASPVANWSHVDMHKT